MVDVHPFNNLLINSFHFFRLSLFLTVHDAKYLLCSSVDSEVVHFFGICKYNVALTIFFSKRVKVFRLKFLKADS